MNILRQYYDSLMCHTLKPPSKLLFSIIFVMSGFIRLLKYKKKTILLKFLLLCSHFLKPTHLCIINNHIFFFY